MAALPQTNPAGGPNPNSAPSGGPQPWQMSIFDLPTVDTTLTGGARAAAIANARQQPQAQPVTYQPPGAGPGMSVPPVSLPGYSPNDPSLVQTPANGVMGQGTGLTNWLDARGAQGVFDDRLSALQSNVAPTQSAIGNWLFNKVGSPQEQDYTSRSGAAQTYARPEAQQYLSAHPSLLAHAEKDPVGFATKLGPILDAAVAAQSGVKTQGTIVHSTPDGPMVKPDDHVEHTNAIAKGFGITNQQAHAMTQGHHYTRDERISALVGTPVGALKNMWEMQHYLNPQQQALSTALAMAHARAADPTAGAMNPAQQEYYRNLNIAGGIVPNISAIEAPGAK